MRKLFVLLSFLWVAFDSNAQPLIQSFSPSSGSSGTTVVIEGSGFAGNASDNIVSFGGVKALVTAASSVRLTVVVPPGASYAPISITTNHLTGYSYKPFLVTFPSCDGFNDKTFDPKKDFQVGYSPFSVCAADLDNDGKPDLAVLNIGASSFSLFKNTTSGGDISFAQKIDLATNTNAQALLITDLTGDGLPDIIVISSGSSTVSVYQNTSTPGTIAFASKVDFVTGSGPTSIAFGDLDRDGRPDLVVANYYSNSFSVLRNTSTGAVLSFDPKMDMSTGSLQPRSVAIGDLDKDGKPEIILRSNNNTQDSLCIYRNTSTNGTLSFANRLNFAATGLGHCVTLADIDGDDTLDIITSNYNTANISVFRNTSVAGSLTLAERTDLTCGSYPEGISIADLNGDGEPDLLVANTNSASFSLLKNSSSRGSINISPKIDYPDGSYPRSLCTADLDLNGTPDVVVANYFQNTVSVFRHPFSQRIFLVDSSKSNSAAVGLCSVSAVDWSKACNNLQTAIDSSKEGDQIWVASGTYKPTEDSSANASPNDPKAKTFTLKSGVKIYGGFTATETSISQRPGKSSTTILSGAILSNGSPLNVYTVVSCFNVNNNSVLDGFTIANGNALANGAGLFLGSSSPTISNCILNQNQSSGLGGGMYMIHSSPVLINCSLVKNKAAQGAGVTAISSSPVFYNCTIAGNIASTNGGGLFGQNDSVIIDNSIIWGNIGPNSSIDNLALNSGTQAVNNSIIGLASGIYPGAGNMNTNPLFVDGDNGNFSLINGSIAIGSGNTALYPSTAPSYDLNGAARIQNGSISLGAYQGGNSPLTNGSGTLYVNGQSASIFALGKSWATAYSNLSDALIVANANTAIKQIWVAKGVYVPTSDTTSKPQQGNAPNVSFVIKRDLQLLGGFSGIESEVHQRSVSGNPTIFDARINYNGVSNNIYSLLYIDGTHSCVIDGFTFTNGGGYLNTYGGGGIDAKNATAAVNNCRFINNAGSGIYSSGATITLSNCYFSGNYAEYGGAIELFNSTATISACQFLDNRPPTQGFPYSYGGAISANGSTLSVDHSEFRGNRAVNAGGAFYCEFTKGSFTNCNFINNALYPYGSSGGAAEVTQNSDIKFLNCAMVQNFAQSGGAVDNLSATVSLINCTITDNTASSAGGLLDRTMAGVIATPASTIVSNSIVWGNKTIYNQSGNFYELNTNSPTGSSFNVNYSIVGDPIYFGTGNINYDPKFVDTSKASVQLQSNSVAIDNGNNNSYSGDLGTDLDLSGHSRLTGSKIDIGAFEYSATVCEGGSTNLISAWTGSSYQWQEDAGSGFVSIIDGNNLSGANTDTLQIKNAPVSWNGLKFRCLVNGSTTYTIVFPLVVQPNQTPAITISADTSAACAGTPIDFTASPTNGGTQPSYQWKINGINTGFDANELFTNMLKDKDQVSLQLTSNASCLTHSSAESNTISITVKPVLTPAVTIAVPKTSFCSSETINFTSTVTNGGSNPMYQWMVNGVGAGTDSSFSSASLIDGSKVQLILQSNAVCAAPTIVQSNPIQVQVTPVPSKPTITVSGNVLTSSASSGNVWYYNGTVIPGATNATYTATASGNYAVGVTSNGCSSEQSATVNLIVTAINSPTLSNKIGIAPNPVHDQLKIWYTGTATLFHMVLMDMSGKILVQKTFTTSLEIDMRSYTKGTYILRIINTKGEQLQRMISRL